MAMNDRTEKAPPGYQETEEQKKKREERERIEKQREEERQKIFQLFNDPKNNYIFGGGYESEEEEDEDENEKEQELINYSQLKPNMHELKVPKGKTKYLNSLNTQEDMENQNISNVHAYKEEVNIDSVNGLEDLEFVADPLSRKKKVNEVINRVEMNLMDDEDFSSVKSESQHNSNQNTIDDARRYVLKQQLKQELGKKNEIRKNK
jgi:hypothetical protein